MGKQPVFFDIDGTLLDYQIGINDILPSCQHSLDRLRQSHPAFIASGRTKCFIVDEILNYPFDGFVTCNGAYVEYKGQCIYKKAISKTAISHALQVADALGAVLYLESHDCIYVHHAHLPSHAIFAEKWRMHDHIVVTDFDPATIEVYIGMIIAPDEKSCAYIEETLQADFDVSRHVRQRSFDLTLKGENKAIGIAEVAKYLDVPMSEIFAFGDGNNDMEMISQVGYGIAMGNAVAPLKAVAYDVTDTVANDGITKALLKYGLIEGENEK